MKNDNGWLHVGSDGQIVGEWAGFVSARFNPRTDALVVVVDDRQGLWSSDSLFRDGDGKRSPWWTICDTHGTLCQHRTRSLATSHAAESEGWCEPCAALVVEAAHEAGRS